MKHGSGRFIPSLVTAALVVFALRVFSDNKADVDLWGNVGFVSALPWSTEFHYRNTYSFTEPDRLWINHEWGAEYLLNLAYRLAGNPGLLALKLVLGLAILGFVVRAVYRDCTTGFVRFVFLLLVLSTIGYGFSTRPHLFTYLLWVVFLVVLRSGSRGRGWKLFALSVLGIVWANLHGAFFLGCALLLVWGLAEFVANILSRPDCGYAGSGSSKFFPVVFLGAAGLFFVLSLFNPYGLRLWEFVFDSAAQFRPYLSEWAPFDPLMHFGYHTDFLALMALTL
ncbi:MAG: hypothetical protein N2255_08350, partial [Kiritimatiellae bacterium]|nr:hypothetical protein [Kiritimatiellia bacterium]